MNWKATAMLRVLAISGLVVFVGCGANPADYPEMGSVSGRVTHDGEPVENARVVFKPATGRGSSGTTDASGNYELRYSGNVIGAVLGKHSVSIFKEVVDPEAPVPSEENAVEVPRINLIPARYSGADSELSGEVTAGKNTIDFELTSQ